MAVLRQQINNHGHQHNNESSATARSPGSYGNNSIDTPPGRRITEWRFHASSNPEHGGAGFIGLRTLPSSTSQAHLPNLRPSEVRLHQLSHLHSQHRTAGIERLVTNENWPGELCPHRRSTLTEQSSVDTVTIYSSDRGSNGEKRLYEFQG
jgi:hypothetical protein